MTVEAPSLRALDVSLEERAEFLCEVARELPDLPPARREELRRRVISFLREDIGEHIRIDRSVLYPILSRRLGDPLVVAPMNYDHRAIGWWTNEIAHADIDDIDELQRLIYGVHAVVKVHLSREEDLYVDAVGSTTWPADF